MAAVAAAGGQPAVPAENRANERTRRVREAFIDGPPNKLKRYLLTQPHNIPVGELCEKLSRRNVLDKLYPENDPDTAFNEVSSTQMNSVATALNSLNKAQTTLQPQVNNMTNQIAALAQGPPHHWYPYPWQTEQPSHGNNRGWYGNNRSYRGNNRGYQGNNRGWRGNRGNRGNYRGPTPNEDMTYSNQRHCRNCNSFGHTAQQCPTKPSPQWSTAALSTAAKKLGEPHQYDSLNYFSSSFSCFLFCVPIAFNDTKINRTCRYRCIFQCYNPSFYFTF